MSDVTWKCIVRCGMAAAGRDSGRDAAVSAERVMVSYGSERVSKM